MRCGISRFFPVALAWVFLAIGTALPASAVGSKPLIVGWHDEFNELDQWSPWTASGGFDILRGDVGKLTVVLGKSSMYMSVYNQYRAGVYLDFDVDLDHFPVLAVRVLRMRNAANWDAQVFQYRDENAPNSHGTANGKGVAVPGNPKHLVADIIGDSRGRHQAELVFVALHSGPSDFGKKHVRLLLNLSGPQQQGFVDFAWARFIRKEDVARLRSNPRLEKIRLSDE